MSKTQVDEKIIPAIVDLDVPLVTSSRLRKAIKAIREGARVASERNRRVTVEDQNVPLPPEELKRSGSLLFSSSKLRLSADEDAGETVVRRLRCQLNKQNIRFEDIMETKTREKETAETRVRHTELGNRTELRECEGPERKQPKTIAAEAYLDVLWTYTSAWSEQAARNFKTNPEQPRPMRCTHTTMNNSFGYYIELSCQSEALTTSLLDEIGEAGKMQWTERVQGPKACRVIHQIRMGRAHDWLWHEEPEVPKRLGALLFSRHKLRFSADEGAGGTVVRHLKRQLNKHCIRFEDILETKTRKGKAAGTTVKRAKTGNETKLTEREGPERKQPKVIADEAHRGALWTYNLGLARAGGEELLDKPSAAETDASQTPEYAQIPLDVTTNCRARTKRFTTSPPRNRALAILKEIEEVGRRLWIEGVHEPEAGMSMHQSMMKQAQVWAWQEKPRERQPTTASQPSPATNFHRQPDFTPRAVDTWATGKRGGRMLCQACQQNQCAGNSCSMGAPVCAMVVRDSGHVCDTKHPACKHRWDKEAAKQESRRDSRKDKRRWGPAVGMDDRSQPVVEQKQAAQVKQYLNYLDSMSQSGSYSRHHGPPRTMPTRSASATRPPQTTDDSGTGVTHRTVVLDAPSGSKGQGGSETDDGCLPPHFVDIFAGKNRPMSGAMEWCGWTTSSCEKFPAECSYIWAEYKCGHSKDVKSESVQTEGFNQVRRAQATWIAPDCRTLTKTDIGTPGQQHHHTPPSPPLRSAKICGVKPGWNPVAAAPKDGHTSLCRQQNRQYLWNRMT